MLSLNIPTNIFNKKRPRTRAGREREYRHWVQLVTAFINGLKKIYPGWENYHPALGIGRETGLLGSHISYAWRNGEALLFDETYLHFARNDSGKSRLILMCDAERPMNFIGKIANLVFKRLMRLTIVPNMEGDKRGLANSIFSRLAPLLKRTKALKATNRRLYLLVKHSINFTLLALVCAALAGLLYVVYLLSNLPMM